MKYVNSLAHAHYYPCNRYQAFIFRASIGPFRCVREKLGLGTRLGHSQLLHGIWNQLFTWFRFGRSDGHIRHIRYMGVRRRPTSNPSQIFSVAMAAILGVSEYCSKETCSQGSYVGQQLDQVTSDNMATVRRDPTMGRLLCCLFFFEAYYGFEHEAKDVRGVDNVAADALSQNRADLFLSLLPQAHWSPTQLPPLLVALLLDIEFCWTSPRWSSLFHTILQEV